MYVKGVKIKAIEACNGDISYLAPLFWTIVTQRKIYHYEMSMLTINTSNHVEKCGFKN